MGKACKKTKLFGCYPEIDNMKTYPSTKSMKIMLAKHRRSILRSTMNLLIENKQLKGKVLDIGSSYCEPPSYYEFFNCQKMTKKILIDRYKHKKPDIVGDAQNLPFKDTSFNTVICFNLIEHVPDPYRVIQEAARVLKKNGQAFFYAPYLTALHSEQKNYSGDFSRLSHSSWKFWASQYFSKVKVYPVAFGPLIQAYVLFEQFIPKLIRNIIAQLSLSFDYWLVNKKPYLQGKYLLAVYVEAVK